MESLHTERYESSVPIDLKDAYDLMKGLDAPQSRQAQSAAASPRDESRQRPGARPTRQARQGTETGQSARVDQKAQTGPDARAGQKAQAQRAVQSMQVGPLGEAKLAEHIKQGGEGKPMEAGLKAEAVTEGLTPRTPEQIPTAVGVQLQKQTKASEREHELKQLAAKMRLIAHASALEEQLLTVIEEVLWIAKAEAQVDDPLRAYHQHRRQREEAAKRKESPPKAPQKERRTESGLGRSPAPRPKDPATQRGRARD